MSNQTYKQKIGFTYEYYILDKIKDDYEKIWHWKDFPEKLMYENNLINEYNIYCKYRYDIGADLVGFKGNKYYFIQCKNFNDTICIEQLAGFYFLLLEYNLDGIVYYNGKISQRVLDLSNHKRIQYINIPFNNNVIDIIPINNINIITRDYQLDVYNKLKDKPISILSLPCGMGKTYCASLIAKNYKNIIILSPLRYLAFQSLNQFKKYLGNDYSPILISIDGKRDEKEINNYLGDKNIISSTYDSADITLKIINKLNNIYIIIDEFHNLSVNNITNNEDDLNKIINLPHHKIFLSATPLKDFFNISHNDTYTYP